MSRKLTTESRFKGPLSTQRRDLTPLYGKGFSRGNVNRIRPYCLAYAKGATASHLLSWSHLQINEVEHHDIGQMNLYLGYFAAEENTEGDNPRLSASSSPATKTNCWSSTLPTR